tara:strand:- start:1920 stop:4799 length:2880 start_codon:yes stop_codon:yes gene_type:complete
MALRIKRGTNAERLSYTPELGELIYVTDYSSAAVAPVFIGDGSTVGGNAVASTGSGGGITDIVNDTTPQLGGNLDLNSYDITGTGDVNITGNIDATGSIDVNLNIDAGGYVNAQTMAANLFNGNLDGDLTGSVFGDDSALLIDGNNNRVLASTWGADNTVMVNTTDKSFSGSSLTVSSDTANIFVDSTITSGNGVALEVRGHNGTLANKTILTAGDTVYNILGKGYDGDSYVNSAIIKMGADKYTTAIADGIVPGRIVFLTYNESGGTSTDNAMVFNRFGNLGIKTDAPAKALDVRGDGIFTGNVQAASMTGTFVADDSTILVDGVAGKVNLAPNNVEDLGNVTIGTPQAGQVLKYNGSAWVNDVDVAGSGGSGGIGNIGVGADDSAIRLINSGESFKILGGTNVTTASDAEGNITVTANIELANDTSPVLGGNLVTNGNRITHAASGTVSMLDFVVTQFGETNNTVLSSVKSINMFLDANGGDAGQAFRIYNNTNPDSNPTESTYIFKVAEDGNTFVKGYLNLNGTTLTGGSDNLTVGSVTSNFIGSVFADDSTLVIDGTNGTIQWARLAGTPTTLAGYGITDAATTAQGAKADTALQPAALGNYDFTGSTVDTNDSSGITVIPAITAQSDLTVENNLYVTNKVVADTFESTSTGTPEITAATNLNLTAGNAVVITQSPVRFASFTTTERDALASQNGDIVYNTTANGFQGRANGSWVALSGSGGLANIVEDTSPQLGGDLDANGNKISFGDGDTSGNYAGFGAADDLKIFHNGNHSIIRETGTGDLYIQSDNNVILSKDSSTELMVKGIADGAVELYHNNVKKFETSADGIISAGRSTFEGGVIEGFSDLTSATGTVAHDCANGHIFRHTSISANFTANFTNIGLTNDHGTMVSLMLVQGGTAYIPNAVQIGGSAQTILWQGGSAPSGTSNGTDIVSFSITQSGGSYTVLGQLTSYS